MNARQFAYSVVALLILPVAASAQTHDASVANHQPHLFAAADFGIDPQAVTFSKDIAPILQRSCQNCHRAGGGAPMSLITYDEVQRYGRRIARKTAIRDRMGAMPPWFVEKDIGILAFKNDPSLSDEELARLLSDLKDEADEAEIPMEPFVVDFSDQLRKIIDEVLAGEAPEEESDAA